ncbi:MAG: cation transporter [Planctomycetes bacterium]|nr:cation transporter [Planctomycetota bacterium]
MSDASLCPSCGVKGRAVKWVTIESLVSETARARVKRMDGFRFCAEPTCDVEYYDPETGDRFPRHDVRVRIGQKETASPRPICYCFGHSIEDIEDEMARGSVSRIADEITEKCRQGLDRCEEMNPQGACCLGNVRRTVKAAQSRAGVAGTCGASAAEAVETSDDCCGRSLTQTSPRARRMNAGALAQSGAILSAIVASACCWLPLLLLAFGVSAAGVGGFFATARPYFLVGAAAFLALGFYMTYFRKPACAPGDGCAASNPKLRGFNQIMLWMATAVVLALAFFPSYIGVLIGGGSPRPALTMAAGQSAREYAFTVEGMHCEACAVSLTAELRKLESVRNARVDYAAKTARVAAIDDQVVAEVQAAAKRLGYSARLE